MSQVCHRQLPALQMSAHIDFQVLNKRQTVGPQIVALHDAVRHVAKICRNGSARKRAPRARVEPRMDTWQPSCFSLAGRWRERQTAPSTLQTVRHRPRRFLAWMSFVLPILKVTASTRKKKRLFFRLTICNRCLSTDAQLYPKGWRE
jgi:hypothetical protein